MTQPNSTEDITLHCPELRGCAGRLIRAAEGIVRLKNASMKDYNTEMWRYARELKFPSPDPRLGHEHVANAHALLQSVDIRTNAWGLRGGPVTDAPAPGTRRIHYELAGRAEGREAGVPPSDWSEAQYLSIYPDVAAEVRRGTFQSGYHHYLVAGRAEGRDSGVPPSAWNEAQYLSIYPDVAAEVATGHVRKRVSRTISSPGGPRAAKAACLRAIGTRRCISGSTPMSPPRCDVARSRTAITITSWPDGPKAAKTAGSERVERDALSAGQSRRATRSQPGHVSERVPPLSRHRTK